MCYVGAFSSICTPHSRSSRILVRKAQTCRTPPTVPRASRARCPRTVLPTRVPQLPGRGGAITTLVLGVVLVVIIAPIVFFATMVAGVAGTEGNSVKGGTTANGANITAFNASPEVVTKVFAMPFVWGTVVGVAGLIVLIVGIVLLVNVNGKRRRITQEAMLGAVR